MSPKRSILFKSEQDMNLRELLGLSQQDLASFCGMSKSHLGMIETNKRSWPMGKGKSDVELIMAYAQAEKEPADISVQEKPDPWEKKIWTRRLLEMKSEKFRKENELNKMEFKLKAARKLLQTCIKLKQNHAKKAAENETLIALWEHLARQRIHQNNEDEQAWLKLRLKQLDEGQLVVEKVLEKWAVSR